MEYLFRDGFDDYDIRKELTDYHESLKDKAVSGATCAFWATFLEMVEILFAFLRAIKIGSWSLHMDATKKMLPWFFAYDRPNYSRFLSLYWADMIKLPDTHPSIYEQFM